MSYSISIDNNRFVERFFAKHKPLEARIKHNIHHVLPELIAHRPHKIKPAYQLKRDKHTILEYKIVLDNHNFRAAYTQHGDEVTVFYITGTTLKRDFVNELAGTTLVD